MGVRVLIVDDSAVTRQLLWAELNAAPGIDVVATAPDPYVARQKILMHEPDLIVLDIRMPRMDGLTFLEALMTHFPLPVIVLSALTEEGSELALEALDKGAAAVVPKPRGGLDEKNSVRATIDQLIHAVLEAAEIAQIQPVERLPKSMQTAATVEDAPGSRPGGEAAPAAAASADEGGVAATGPRRPGSPDSTARLIAIGASAGGTQAIEHVLSQLPADAPPIVVVLHMPEPFTAKYADRLNAQCALEVMEASDRMILQPGMAAIARGNYHLRVQREPAGLMRARLDQSPPVNRHRPSVDVLFESVAAAVGRQGLGVILTGMGSDGAAGLLTMRRGGAYTISQSQATCTVYGMPRAALESGAVSQICPLDAIPSAMLSWVKTDLRADADVSACGSVDVL